MPARIRELFQPNRTSNFANVNKVNSLCLVYTSSSSLDTVSVENFSSAVDSVRDYIALGSLRLKTIIETSLTLQ